MIATRTGSVGGAERLIQQMVPAVAREHQVTVATARMPWESDEALPTQARAGDLRDLLAGPCDVLHTHLFLPGILARIRRVFNPHFRWVHTVHYDGYDGLSFPGWRRWIDHSWVFPATDRLIAVSDKVAEGLPTLPQISVVPNAVPLGRVERTRARGEGVTPVVGCLSMLRTEKGIDDLIAAVAILAESGRHLRLRLAGAGPERERLEAMAAELGVSDRVEFLGYTHDLDGFYGGLDLYVQPSRTESFGLATLDAMRFGLPIVTSRVGNLPALLGDGEFGRLVSRTSEPHPKDLAEEILAALDDPAEGERCAERGRRHWEERLAPEQMDAAHLRIYAEVSAPRVLTVATKLTVGGGGLPRQALLQSRALASAGHRVLLLQEADAGLVDAAHAAPWSHATILETPPRPPGPPRRLDGVRFILSGFWKAFRRRRLFDVVHAHQLYAPTVLGALISRFLGKGLVVRVTASGVLGEAAELAKIGFSPVRRWAFWQVDGVIVMTDTMRAEVRGLGFPDRIIHTIPNAVEVPPEPAAVPRHARVPNSLRVLYTGRLSSEKSLDTVVAAVGVATARGVEVHLDLVGGPGGDRDVTDALKAQVAELKLEDHVHFHGRSDDVPAFLSGADVFVLPSLSEGMSNALLEAMAAGLPCLVSDIPENRALIDATTGFLFPVQDAPALGERFVQLAGALDRDPGPIAAVSRGARDRIQAHHSEAAIARRLDTLYRSSLPRSMS